MDRMFVTTRNEVVDKREINIMITDPPPSDSYHLLLIIAMAMAYRLSMTKLSGI